MVDIGAAATPKAASQGQSGQGPEDDGKLRIICFGAHPDDCEFRAGGTAAKWAKLGHHVKFISVTNGDIGHWNMAGGALAKRRTAEVHEAAKVLSIEAEVLDIRLPSALAVVEGIDVVGAGKGEAQWSSVSAAKSQALPVTGRAGGEGIVEGRIIEAGRE